MARKKRQTKIKELPEELKNIRHVVLDDINEMYILFEDGRLFSRLSGKFLKISMISKTNCFGLQFKDGRHSLISLDLLLKKYFGGLPEIEGVNHKPLKNFENDYEVYSNGDIFSKRQYIFIKTKLTNTNWPFISIVSDKKRYTIYNAKAVYETFVGPIDKKYKLIFKDGDKKNCSLKNLDIEIKKFSKIQN